MIYISGEKELIETLRINEGYLGSLAEYTIELKKRNPRLNFSSNYLPSYMAIQLVTLTPEDPKHATEIQDIVNSYSSKERLYLRKLQDDKHDIPSQVTAGSILEDFYQATDHLKHMLSYPVVTTSVTEFNKSLTNKSLLKIPGEGFKHAAKTLQNSSKWQPRSKLVDLMDKRNRINLKICELGSQKNRSILATKNNLNKEAADLTRQIKQIIREQLPGRKRKYLHGYSPEETRKMSTNSASLKTARKGGQAKINLTHLEKLNKTGLALHRNMIKGYKIAGHWASKGASYFNYTLSAFEVVKTYREGGDWIRRTFQEASAIGVNRALFAAAGGVGLAELGGIVIGAAAGDLALGTAILVCYPVIGWVVLFVAGAALAGYVSYQTKDLAQQVWESETGGYIRGKASEFAGWIWDEFKLLGQQIIANDL